MVKVHYGTPDASGLAEIIGYYPDTENYASIPEPYIEVDEAAHVNCYANPGRRKVNVFNQCIVEYALPDTTIDEQAAQIEASYKLKIAVYLNLILVAIGAGGASQDSKIATYQTKISELTTQMNNEMEELYNA